MKAFKNAYKINPIELCDDNGNVTATVSVLTDYVAMHNRLRADLGLLAAAKKDSKGYEDIGRLTCKLLSDLYGDDGMNTLLAFYENDYNALVNVTMQHIYEDVKPGLEKISADRVNIAKKANGGIFRK